MFQFKGLWLNLKLKFDFRYERTCKALDWSRIHFSNALF
mgnify:CR=1 FL=1